jgi:hypothetical protein
MAHPSGWTPEQSQQLHFMTKEQAHERLLPMSQVRSLDIVLDYETGKEMYIGRTTKAPLLDE